MKIFYFTSTGNSLDIARRFEAELFSIPKLNKKNEISFSDEKIGFVFPCYFSGIPRPVTEFISKAELKADYYFAVVTCGNFTGAANYSLKKAAAESGFEFDYINDIRMVDNYIPMFEIKKELDAEPGKKIEESVEAIKTDVAAGRKLFMYKGFLLKVFTSLMQKMYRGHVGKADLKLSVDEKCNSCGICARVCPVQNINVTDKPVYSHRCEECFACLHNCPQTAIHHKKEKSAVRFRNRNVSLNDIIFSNSSV